LQDCACHNPTLGSGLVYCGPLFTGIFSHLILAEPLTRLFFVCGLLDVIGVCLIVQPKQMLCFLWKGDECGSSSSSVTTHYYAGALLALCSAAMAGILPVTVRKSRDVHWTTVEHVTAAMTAFLFTPVASVSIALWEAAEADGTASTAQTPLRWSELSWTHVGVIGGAAMIEFLGLALQTIAYQKVKHAASASLVNYIEVPFAFFLQLMFFGPEGDLISAAAGALLIVCAGGVHLSTEFKGATPTTAIQCDKQP